MFNESVCHVARSWMDVGSFQTRLVATFMIFTALVRNILDSTSYKKMATVKEYVCFSLH
jgi:hypothetical protein